jgi:hypothetical protein
MNSGCLKKAAEENNKKSRDMKQLIKCKATPVPGRGGPLSCQTSRLQYFLDNRLIDGGEVFNLTHLSPFNRIQIPGTHFC